MVDHTTRAIGVSPYKDIRVNLGCADSKFFTVQCGWVVGPPQRQWTPIVGHTVQVNCV